MNMTRILCAVSWLVLSSHPVFGQGWTPTSPPILATLSSAKRNNVFYVGEQPTFRVTPVAVRYEARDYYGTLVDQGAITGTDAILSFNVNVTGPGWYKLYVYGGQDQGAPWGYSVGGTTFVIFRNDANFPPLPVIGDMLGSRPTDDEVMRRITAMGPQRLYVQNASDPNTAIAELDAEIAVDEALYVPFDPVRTRPLLINFPNGTDDTTGVQQIVTHFKDKVQYWEGRNEPNGAYTGTAYALCVEKQFYQTVKGVDPGLEVLGPAVSSVDPGTQSWISDFLSAGGGGYIDAFSFHAYNCVNGDWWLLRTSLNSLKAQLAAAKIPNVPVWQTEQGYMAAVYGSYQPRLQGRWTMLQMMGYEQYGIPKEHNHLWYDTSHGFWDEPMWWENGDGGLNPAGALMRVWSEELFGTQFTKAYDFGSVDNEYYIGDFFMGGTKSVAAFMTAGNPYGSVRLSVNKGDHVHMVSPFGVGSDLPVTGGNVTLPVSEMPVYVELAQGQTCTVLPRVYGKNLSIVPGVTVHASGLPASPVGDSIPNDPSKIVNGVPESWYWNFTDASRLWMSNVTSWPATVEIDLPAAAPVSDVIIQAGVPWQFDGTLLDYDLQYWNGTAWTEIEHVTEPTKTMKVYSPVVQCTTDSFFSDRCVFEHHFSPVKTNRVRLVVNDVTYGGGATADVVAAGGQTGPHQITLREVSIFQQANAAPVIVVQPANAMVDAGATTLLSVLADTQDAAEYVWQKDGTVIQDSAAAILTIDDATAPAQGVYNVVVMDSGGATVSAPATVWLNTPLNQWISRYFPQTLPGDVDALLASDTAGDGISNLLKYYFDIPPTGGGTSLNLPQTILENAGETRYVTLSYITNPAATDVHVNPLCSDDPASNHWTPTQPDIIQTLPTGAFDGAVNTLLKFRVDGPGKFFRLQLVLAGPADSPVPAAAQAKNNARVIPSGGS